MFDIVSSQFNELMLTFANDRGFFGAIGLTVFVVAMLLDFQLPRTLRNSRRIWMVEIFVAPSVVFA